MEGIITFFQEYWILGYSLVVILGVVLGFSKKITVFRDYADLGLVFLMALIPVGLIIIFSKFLAFDTSQMSVIYYTIIALELLLMSVIVIRTHRDNGNVIKTLLAILTKLPLGFVFIFYLINFIAPGGKNYSIRGKTRREGLIITLFLGIIVKGIVKTNKWTE